ncbi:YggT family protein [Calorimonas adulescens]|uniref:YggT family protein n=1 Tax=Calorimonas adulescens TaxID=2606906 RepID=UPI001EF00023|nr:YggT family protein [Calorimonas adulescens]
MILTFNIFLNILNILIFIRVFLSYIRIDYYNPIIRLVYELTEPILSPFRRLLMNSSISKAFFVDFSPMIALLFIDCIVRPLIINLIYIIF